MKKKISLHGLRQEYEISFKNSKFAHDVEACLLQTINILKEFLLKQIKLNKKLYKFQIKFNPKLKKFSYENNRYHFLEPFFATEQCAIYSSRQINKLSLSLCKEILGRYDSFMQHGSGWLLVNTNKIIIIFHVYKPFKGGCKSSPPLPPFLQNKKALVCVNTEEKDKCFLYSVIAALTKKSKNPQRICKEYKDLLNYFDYIQLDYPVGKAEIKSFEKQTDISVNVYGYERKVICPYYISNIKKDATRNHVNLLLHKGHYYAIRSMSALICTQCKNNTKKVLVCNYCLSYFVSKEKFEFHEKICMNTSQRFEMPTEDKMTFRNYRNILPASFVVYCDIESICSKEEKISVGKTFSKSKHKAISVCAYVVCRDNPAHSSKSPFLYTGTNCIEELFHFLFSIAEKANKIIRFQTYPLNMTEETELHHKKCKNCNFCKKVFVDPKDKCRDHNHLQKENNYRQTLCNACNLSYAAQREEIYVIFHGLSNYDGHFLVQEMHKLDDRYIRVIPKNTERYLSFSIHNLHFKDSIGFLPASLAELVKTIKDKGEEYFTNVSSIIQDTEKRKCLYQKGIFPYSWLNSIEKLKQKYLPSKECFFNDLSNESISEKDYTFATKVWELFECKTMQDYMEIYLLADVLLLADVFENYRSRCLIDYNLDPLHYFSAAHFSFDCYLRMTKVELDLFKDINKYLFISRGIRGGLSFISKREADANNKYLKKYEPSMKSTYIIYIDCNNLYGWSMLQPLPYKDFEWVAIDLKRIMQLEIDSEFGYIVQVDLEYPQHLHSMHSDYPLAPEKRKINKAMLSPFSKFICQKNDLKLANNVEKLVTTFLVRKDYIVHYRTLQLYLSLGMKVVDDKIKSALQFRQKPIMADYINFNSKKRAESTNSFDINYFKSMNNSTFGKTMERTDSRTICKLVNKKSSFEKYVSKPTFKTSEHINSKLVALNMKYPSIKLNKPIYLGFSILELAKYYMFHFHYNVIKKKFGNKAQLLFTDTDSLMYEIETNDVYQDFSQMLEHFDFSNYPSDHPLFSEKNKRIPGFFKDEVGGKIIKSFVGLKSKMYAFKLDDTGKEFKSAKGVKKSVIEKDLNFVHFKECLLKSKIMEHDFKAINSKRHIVSTVHQKKISLNSFDDKRYLLDHKFTLPYGHKMALDLT